MSTVLVTGATGFIGSAVLCCLADSRRDALHAVSRTGAPAGPGRAGCTWHAADLLQPGQAARLIATVRPTHLLHLAWTAEPGRYLTAPENFAWVRASLELLEAFQAAGGRRAVLAGSCIEYDWSAGRCVEERTPLSYASPYAACKNAMRELLAAMAARHGFSWGWGRVFLLYGPREPERKLVASVIGSLLAGQPAQCSEGSQQRDFLHVADVATAFVTLLRAEYDGIVNIGSGCAVSVRELVTTLGRLTGREDLLRFAPPPATPEAPLVVADTARLRDTLGWRPRFTLAEGLADAVRWWQSQRQSA